jgi:hypothetical protein
MNDTSLESDNDSLRKSISSKTNLSEVGFAHLNAVAEREGHCRVARTYKMPDGYPVGQWAARQRSRQEKMDPDRRQRLEALPGWVWKVEK